MIGQTISHYRILEKLGEGGMGVVYLAEDTHLGRRVAIKFLTSADKHYRARFLREARAVSAISHANIAAVFDYGETPEQRPYIVMELVKGKTISDLLRDGGLTLAQAVEITSSIAMALSEAHHHGIVHRDIKPSNVVVNERGQVKVLDFGLVKQLFPEQASGADPDAKTLLSARTRSDVIVGTPLYLSPEQASGKAIDGRSDLFSLGAMLYECITGRSAFAGDSVLEIGAQVIHVTPPLPSSINSSVPPALDRITMKALEKSVEARYQSADEMLKDLRAVLSTIGESRQTLIVGSRATPAGGWETLTQNLKRTRFSIFTVIAAIVVSALAVWAVIHFWRPRPYEPTPATKNWYDRGTDAVRNGAYFAATKSLEQAISGDDRFALAHARLAEALSELEYRDRAKDELLRVSALVPDRSSLATSDALYLEGVNFTVSRDFPSAIKSYQAIADLSSKEPQAFVDLGRAYERNDQNDKALENYLKAIELNGQYATAYLRAGIIYSRKQNIAAASSALDKAQELFSASSNAEGETEVFRQRGLLLKATGKFTDAREQFTRELDRARYLGNESQQVTALLDLSGLSGAEGATVQAKDYANQAVQLAQQHGLDSLVAQAWLSLGDSFYAQGDYGEAEKYFKQGIDAARSAKHKFREHIGLKSLGSLYIHESRTDEGLPLVEQAKAFFQQGNYLRDYAGCLTAIGRGHRHKGDFPEALQAFQEELQLAKQNGNLQPLVAFSYGEIGAVLYEQERFPEALEQYNQAFAINKPIGDRLGIAFNQANRGEILWRLGRYDEAQKALDEAVGIATDPASGYKQLIPEIERTSAQQALSERRFAEAKVKAQHAISLAGNEYKGVTIEANYTLGLVLARNGSGREGQTYCENAVKMAADAGDAAWLSRALLALAESTLNAGDATAALEKATTAQDRFAKGGQQESQWRSLLLCALANQRLGNHDIAQQQLTQARGVLNQLMEKWGSEASQKYLSRPDIQVFYKQLG